MRRCILDGGRLLNAAAVYRSIGDAFRLSQNFADSPDSLRDALGRYSGEPVAIVWRNAARSSHLLGSGFTEIVAALQQAAARGSLTLELA